MSGINYVDNPGCPVRFAARFGLDCELSSTASLSPEDGVEGINASVPNVENEAATGSTIEPISSLRPPQRGKRYVYVWHCCACDKAKIGIMVEHCPDCGAQRCPYCRTEKVRVQ